MRLLYFAWVRERIGCAEEEVDLPADVRDVSRLLDWLAARGEGYREALSDCSRLRVAVDQDYAGPDTALEGAKEVAIFPPVTGGRAAPRIEIRTEPIEMEQALAGFGRSGRVGAVVTFTGRVREREGERRIVALELEHYPGMTERRINAMAEDAMRRWQLEDCLVVHRVGRLIPGETIVLVATAAAHRAAAFEAAAFLMDWLKTDAPFWKLETSSQGSGWVEARDSDAAAAARWREDR